jgi:hypothetical protein
MKGPDCTRGAEINAPRRNYHSRSEAGSFGHEYIYIPQKHCLYACCGQKNESTWKLLSLYQQQNLKFQMDMIPAQWYNPMALVAATKCPTPRELAPSVHLPQCHGTQEIVLKRIPTCV